MNKKIGGISCCRECPLRIYRRVIGDDFKVKSKSYCVGNSVPYHPGYSYFIRLTSIDISDLELTDLSIIHPDCPLEDDIVVKDGDIK